MPDLTYTQLVHAVESHQVATARSAEAIRVRAQALADYATDTRTDAKCLSAMSVDSDTFSEAEQLARNLDGVSDAVVAYASAADTTARCAKAAADQARTTHSGIQEAVSRAPVDATGVNRAWFQQQ
ncbi:hypothetical protein [Streptomyces hydrogenans]|uniref:hypothetical protein n=1 Tax=Streptomyces hydrogenans TaxID=1873719 RepID=UPI0036E0F1E6